MGMAPSSRMISPEDSLEQAAWRLPRLWGQETGLPENPLGARLVFELEREDVMVTAVRFNGVRGVRDGHWDSFRSDGW